MRITNFIKKSPLLPILTLSRQFTDELQSKLDGYSIAIWPASVIVAIYFEERECGISELSRTINLKRSRMSQILKSLEESGHIERYSKRGNARSKYVKLTDVGSRKAVGLIKIFDSLTTDIEKKLGRKSSEGLAETLQFLRS